MGSYKEIKHLKVLIPSLRIKKRYVGVRIISEQKIEYEEFEKCFWQNLYKLFGVFGSAYFNLKILKETFKNNSVIIRCNHNSTHFLITSLGFLREINGKKVNFEIVRVSGSIKKVKEFLKI